MTNVYLHFLIPIFFKNRSHLKQIIYLGHFLSTVIVQETNSAQLKHMIIILSLYYKWHFVITLYTCPKRMEYYLFASPSLTNMHS